MTIKQLKHGGILHLYYMHHVYNIVESSHVSHGSLIEQLDVSVLHVLLVFGHCSVCLLLAAKDDLSIATWSVVSVEFYHHIFTVGNGTEPLQHKP